jgi:hypothetical protein
MNAARRGEILLGSLLIAIGAIFTVVTVSGIDIGVAWPLFIVVPGLVLFASSFAVGGQGGAGLAVAGSIVTVVGLILAVQAATDLYATWAYAWALVAPGGVGFGLVVYGLVIGDRAMVSNGLPTLGVGLALFLGFGVFFEGIIGLSGDRVPWFGTLAPVALIALGVAVLLGSLRRRRA